MEEYFKLIAIKIKESGYPDFIDGEDVYNEICDQIEDKDPGTYLFLSKKEGGVFFEYKIDVMEDQFNLSYLTINTPSQSYHIDFDA